MSSFGGLEFNNQQTGGVLGSFLPYVLEIGFWMQNCDHCAGSWLWEEMLIFKYPKSRRSPSDMKFPDTTHEEFSCCYIRIKWWSMIISFQWPWEENVLCVEIMSGEGVAGKRYPGLVKLRFSERLFMPTLRLAVQRDRYSHIIWTHSPLPLKYLHLKSWEHSTLSGSPKREQQEPWCQQTPSRQKNITKAPKLNCRWH